MKKQKEKFNYEEFEKEAIKKLRSGSGFTGENGALTGLIGRIIKAAFEEEIEDHIENSEEKNRRNGYTKKQIQTGLGPVEINPPRDRKGNFKP